MVEKFTPKSELGFYQELFLVAAIVMYASLSFCVFKMMKRDG
jgi:hypothetical protein